jgi:hypothetical protein
MTDEKNELMTLGDLKGGSLQKATDESFEESRTSAFLPRLQLMTANADLCKEGKFPINHFALVRDQKFQDLGTGVDALVCSWRHMALTWGEDTLAVYDHTSDAYLEIQEKANEKVDGNMWGYQVLVWVPACKSFATWFAGSPTARRAFPDLKALMDEPTTFGSQKITGKGKNPNVWFGPTHDECSTQFEMPSKAAYEKEMQKFNNPTVEAPELAEEDGRAQ